MPKVSLTTFVDFATASGSARLTKVVQAKKSYASAYSPQRDYYKPLREAIEEVFESGWNAADLKKRLAAVSDPKKATNYELCRKGLTRWAGRKSFVSHEKPSASWRSGGLTVRVNPELDLDINGTRHLIKLYFKGDPLSKSRADVILHLIGSSKKGKNVPAVLDVRRAKLYVPTVSRPGMAALLQAEAAAFTALWEGV